MMKIRNGKKILFGAIGILAVGLLANFGLNGNNQAEAGWSPGDWINEAFWAGNPSDGNIIYALYGDGTPGSSPYNQYWTDGCLPNPDNIFHVNTSNYTVGDTNINNIQANSIYILESGNYNLDNLTYDTIRTNSLDCIAIIGKTSNTMLAGPNHAIWIDDSKNTIIDNLVIQGDPSNNGVYIQNSNNNTLNNIETYNAKRGISLFGSNNNIVNNTISHNNITYGIWINDGSNSNYILDSQVYNHHGADDAGIMIEDSSKYNVISNTHVYNNDAGIKLDGGTSSGTRVSLNTINNSQIYNNSIGVYLDGNYVNENIVNNSSIYNNGYGYYTDVNYLNPEDIEGEIGDEITYNYIEDLYYEFEDRIINNFRNSVYASFTDNLTSVSYGSNNPINYINANNFYNNNTGILLDTSGNGHPATTARARLHYFGANKLFANEVGIDGSQSNLDTGTVNLLGRSNGTLVYDTEEMSKYWITNPINTNGDKLITNFTDRTANRGTGVWNYAEPTKYVIGKNINKQITPVKWINDGAGIYPINNRGIFGMDYNTNKYIAEVNMELNADDEALVNYYYGEDSEFVVNWNENNCSLGAFTVEYIANYTELFNELLNVGADPVGHTIYVLADGTYNLQFLLDIKDSCIAIVAEGTGVTLSTNDTIDALISLEGQENIILDGITLDGNNNANYGINLNVNGSEKSKNNTLNNVKSYNHLKNGIMLGMGAEYNTIMNTQVWNNSENGIEIYYAGNYNIINNSLAYNNGTYGLRFGNGSKFNTINNSQFFDNNVGGIFADFTTQQNIINNVHAYNNTDYGINFKRSSGNTLNNIYAYNNDIGINMTDVSCVNNTFNGDLVLFGNTGGNLDGTNADDEYLSSAGATSTLQWVVGSLQTGENTMDCSRATNPRHTNEIVEPAIETWFLSGDLNCTEVGTQSVWNASFNGYDIDYMFGQSISKQIAPVGYDSGSIENLDSQYDIDSYIGEVNPIIWTNPSYISFAIVENSGLFMNLDPNTIYEINVDYGTSMINHNFDVMLTLDPVTTTGHMEVKTEGTWTNIGTGTSDLPFDSTEIRLVITTLSGYYQTISGELYIGTEEYGSTVNSFTMITKADPTPPTITWTDNIDDGSIWEGESNTWQATTTGIYAIETYAQYVTGANDCNSGVAIPGNIYLGITGDIAMYPQDLNDKYVCIYVEDTINGQITTGLSNQIKISALEFVDDVEVGPVYYDIVDINFDNLSNYGYRRVNTGSECGTGLSGLTFTTYINPIVLNSDLTFNGKYICAYGEDSTGSGKYILSTNDMNISNYGDTVNLSDDVEEVRVSSDTISVYFSSTIVFDQKQYKWVDDFIDCTDTSGMVDYVGSITITNDDLNGKYFCLYSHEQVSGIENYLLSPNSVKVDVTAPTTPLIESPIEGEDVTFLIVETYGANDSESGLTGFEYEIADNATFLDIIEYGVYYTTGTDVIPEFDEDEDTYAIRVRAVDAVGNVSDRSSSIEFDYQELNDFRFDDEDDAEPGESYISNEIEMDGLDTNETILATVTAGVIYRNDEPKGNSTLVQNNDMISIEMFSSEDYDERVETELVIANRTISWEINTMDEDDEDRNNCDLSNTQKLAVAATFNAILETYTSDSQLALFLITMQSMLEDNIDLSGEDEDACSMDYLLDMIDDYLDDELDGYDNSDLHIAPNCKEYDVAHSEAKNAYYSPDMTSRTYFGSRDELGKYLDSKNPGDCHVNTYGDTTTYDNTDPNRHVAPNGKVYTIETSDIGYTSPDFTFLKYFASIGELRNYIDVNNPAVMVWDHDVDTDFEPIIHTAPNGKTYKIYKTNRGYMSYRFLNVKYFGSLEELTSYIDRYNG